MNRRRNIAAALIVFAACEKPPAPAPPPPSRVSSPILKVTFEPKAPVLHTRDPADAGGAKLFDYARFSVTLTNTSDRPVRLRCAYLTGDGDRERRIVGDVTDRWAFTDPERTIEPHGESKAGGFWGFAADTPNRTVAFVFEFQYVVGDEKSTTTTRAWIKPSTE